MVETVRGRLQPEDYQELDGRHPNRRWTKKTLPQALRAELGKPWADAFAAAESTSTEKTSTEATQATGPESEVGTEASKVKVKMEIDDETGVPAREEIVHEEL